MVKNVFTTLIRLCNRHIKKLERSKKKGQPGAQSSRQQAPGKSYIPRCVMQTYYRNWKENCNKDGDQLTFIFAQRSSMQLLDICLTKPSGEMNKRPRVAKHSNRDTRLKSKQLSDWNLSSPKSSSRKKQQGEELTIFQ